MNSFTGTTLTQMREAVKDAAADPQIGVLVITGAGDRAFCAGGDVRWLQEVQRGGEARTVHVQDIKTKTVVPIVNANIAREARVMTDDALQYEDKLDHFAEHGVVNHSAEEYVSRADPTVHTQSVESYFALFKRGMRGVYQHCDERHLHRYLSEFSFRHNNRVALGVDDKKRAERLLRGVKGRRLTYKQGTQRKVD